MIRVRLDVPAGEPLGVAVRPIVISCKQPIRRPTEQVRALILDTEQWTSFTGHGPIPGIREARVLERVDGIVGTRIAVENIDGSRHVEEVVESTPDGLVLRLDDFSSPLRHLATHFIERWRFEPGSNATNVERSMELHPRSALGRPALWVIGRFLAAALDAHLRFLSEHAEPT